MTLFDVKALEAEVDKELGEEASKAAKGKIKEHRKRLEAARKVVKNLEDEYAVLLRDIADA